MGTLKSIEYSCNSHTSERYNECRDISDEIKEAEQILEENRNIENKIKDIERDIKIYESDIENKSLIQCPVEVNQPLEFNNTFYEEICISIIE